MVARITLLAVSTLTIALAAAGLVSAQSAEVTLEGLAPAIESPIAEGGSASLDFTVRFVAEGFGCPSASSVEIAVTFDPNKLPAGVTAALEAPNVTIAIPQGIYSDSGVPVAPVFNGSAPNKITVAGGNITANATGQISLVASYAGGTPAGCQAPSSLPAASSETAVATLSALAPPPPPPPEEPPAESPAPAGVLVALALVGASLLARRRRSGP